MGYSKLEDNPFQYDERQSNPPEPATVFEIFFHPLRPSRLPYAVCLRGCAKERVPPVGQIELLSRRDPFNKKGYHNEMIAFKFIELTLTWQRGQARGVNPTPVKFSLVFYRPFQWEDTQSRS